MHGIRDLEFRFCRRPISGTTYAEWASTLSRFMGKVGHINAFYGAMRRMIKVRRAWLAKLRDCGWNQLDGINYLYARNCLPCSVNTEQRGIQACQLGACPFCHARHVASVYSRMKCAMKCLVDQGLDFRIVRHRVVHDRGNNSLWTDRIVTEPSGRLDVATFNATVVPWHRAWHHVIRETFFEDAFAGYSWYAYIPVLEDPDATDIGRWVVVQSTVALLPIYWDMKCDAILPCDTHTVKTVAQFIGNAMRYPISWLSADPKLMAELLNATQRTHFFMSFGKYRGLHE